MGRETGTLEGMGGLGCDDDAQGAMVMRNETVRRTVVKHGG